jgi:hypothetical protein
MRTLIYKRTHSGDPDPRTGVFGNNDCMKSVRGWPFNAVIGIGGIGREPQDKRIAGKLTWVGIGAHKTCDDPDHVDRPLVTFDHFLYYGEQGPLLREMAPLLARRMYGKNVRVLMNSLSPNERREVEGILELARNAPRSSHLTEPDFRDTSGRCRPHSPYDRSTNDCRSSRQRNIKVK